MADLKTILDIVRQNEETARKFFEIEKRILSILDFAGLFEVLLTEIRNQFKVPYAWISLVGKSDVTGFIQNLAASEKLQRHLRLVDKRIFEELVGRHRVSILVNKDLKRFTPLFPEHRILPVRSIAIAPLTLDGNLIGSLNQGDLSPDRFRPGIDVSLLDQLAVKVSICLSNVTAHEKLRFLAFHDALTGLLNRRVMESIMEREYGRAKRYRSPLSLIFLDLDDFKSVNDLHGHDLGDDLLKYVANNLSGFFRKIDVVARFAGDEFLVLLPETEKANAQRLMERLCDHFARHPFRFSGQGLSVSVSYGIASAGDADVTDSKALLKKADAELYAAKKAKKTEQSLLAQGGQRATMP